MEIIIRIKSSSIQLIGIRKVYMRAALFVLCMVNENKHKRINTPSQINICFSFEKRLYEDTSVEMCLVSHSAGGRT